MHQYRVTDDKGADVTYDASDVRMATVLHEQLNPHSEVLSVQRVEGT